MSLLGLDIDDLYPFGVSVGDQFLPKSDNGFISVDLSVIFPYFDEAERRLFVSPYDYEGGMHGVA